MGEGRHPQSSTVARDRRSFLALLGLIALVGVGIRVVDVALAQWGVQVGGDAAYYRAQAIPLSHGHFFVEPFDYAFLHETVRSGAHPPLFTLVLAFGDVLHLSGVNATRLFCCAIGGVGIVMVGLLANEVAGRRAGLVAAVIAAIYPVWFLTDGLVLAEVLYVPLVAGLLLIAYRLWHRPRLTLAVGLGALGGLVGLTRSEGLLLLVLVGASVLLLNRTLPVARRATLLGACLLTAAVVVAPWVGFNLARFDRPVFLSTNDGATIADANCPTTYAGQHLGGYVFDCHVPKVPKRGDESDVSYQLRKVGVRYARDHASRVPVVVAARIGRTWGLFNPVIAIDVDSFGKWSHRESILMLFSFYAVAVGGIAGMVVLRRRGVTIVPFVAAIVSVTITVALFYGIIRFRVPGDVSLVVLSAVALDALLARTRRSDHAPATDGVDTAANRDVVGAR